MHVVSAIDLVALVRCFVDDGFSPFLGGDMLVQDLDET